MSILVFAIGNGRDKLPGLEPEHGRDLLVTPTLTGWLRVPTTPIFAFAIGNGRD
jgi:hypothetical protein